MDNQHDVTVGYAPSSRATCHYCNKKIEKGELRVTKKTRSEYHDGFDLKWNHALCQLKSYPCTAIKGIETLRYSDVLKLAQLKPEFFKNLQADSKAQEKGFISDSDQLWEFIETLEEKVKATVLKDIIVDNDIPIERLDLYDQLFFMGMGLHRGLLDPCPVCSMNTLIPFRDEVICRGWISGFTKCAFVGKLGDYPNRFKFRLEAGALQNKFLKDFAHPDPKFYATFKDRPKNGGSAVVSGGESSAPEPEAEKNYELPQAGKECEGMAVCFAGTGIPSAVKDLIEIHGGELSKTVTKNTTHVIVADPPEQQESAKAVKDALNKCLPVLPLKFLYDLVAYPVPGAEPEAEATGETTPSEDAPVPMEETPTVEEAPPVEEKPKRGRGKKAASAEPGVEEAAPLPTRSSRRIKAAPVVEPPPPPPKKAASMAKGRGKGKAKETVAEEKKPGNVQLRLPKNLKDSGLLLFGSEPGQAHLPEIVNKKRKAEDDAEGPDAKVARVKLPPKPGSDVLKVDPASKLHTKGEILLSDDGLDAYNCTLNNVDLASGKNRFYIIQIIKVGNKYHLFKKWGRTGGGPTDGNKCEAMGKAAAIEAFEEKFFECTGNRWEDKDDFVKKPTRYAMVALDDGNDSVEDHEVGGSAKDADGEAKAINMAKSKLDERVQKLMTLLFDKKEMDKVLSQMNIDTKKMPLGKLSKTTILNAYKLLKKIEEFLQMPEDQARTLRILDASTQFYSLIPHSFAAGVRPPPIDKQELLRDKVTMLDSLLDMEIAGKIMGVKLSTNVDGSVQNEMDARYDSLQVELVPLDKNSEAFAKIKKFTQCSDHKIDVLDIFEVSRKGEAQRFQPFEKEENRQLLWHGSRLTNWVGILSQGLRIAPPEAPVSGYLFGKGVYFANMIEKSAHYCRADRSNPYCLLSLSEVYLGKMYEVTNPEYMEKAKNGYHSTKALGRRYPDPKGDVRIPDENGPILPLGNIISNPKTTMGHDELIVYSENQVKCRYLIQGKFIY